MSLWGCHHQGGSSLLVGQVDVCSMVEEKVYDLKKIYVSFYLTIFLKEQTLSWKRGQTCQCPCRTALNSGTMPRLLDWATAAPCSSNRRHTSSFPLPEAAVKAGQTKHTSCHVSSVCSTQVVFVYIHELSKTSKQECVSLTTAGF